MKPPNHQFVRTSGTARKRLLGLTLLCLLIGQGRAGTATAAPGEVARWGEGALTGGGVAVAPNGRVVAVATTIGVRLHDPTTHALLRTFATSVPVAGLAFAPDSRTLAVGLRDGTVELWRVAAGQRVRRLAGLDGLARRVLFTPDGRLIIALSGWAARIWRVADGHPVSLPGGVGNTGGVSDLAFAPNGLTFAVVLGCDLQLRRWRDGAVLRSFTAAGFACGSHVALAPDGQTLAADGFKGVALWRISDGSLLRTFPVDLNMVWSLQFAPAGQTLLVAYDVGLQDPPKDYIPYLQLWRVADGAALHLWDGHWLPGPAFAPDGRTVLIASRDAEVHTWRVADGAHLPSLTTLQPVVRFAVAPGGTTVAVSQGGGVRLRRLSDGQVVRTLGADLPPAQVMTFAPSGQTLAVSTAGRVYLWHVADGRLLWSRPVAFDQATGLVFTADGTHLVLAGFHEGDQDAGHGYPAEVWRATDGQFVRTLGSDPAFHLAVSAKAGILAVGGLTGSAEDLRPTITLWRIKDWQTLQSLPGAGGFADLAMAPDGWRLAAAGLDTGVQLWQLPAGTPVRTLVPGGDPMVRTGPVALAFAPDGRTVAVGDEDSSLTIRRVADGQILADLAGHEDAIDHLAFTPDGRLLLSSASDGTLRIWRIR